MNERMTEAAFAINEAILGPALEALAERAGCSDEMLKRQMRVAYALQQRNGNEPSAEIGKLVIEHLAYLGNLERKARLYDLLIADEKRAQEEMAGK